MQASVVGTRKCFLLYLEAKSVGGDSHAASFSVQDT